jgi:hypothetical protein
VLAGTGIDRQGESFELYHLEQMVRSIRERGMWLGHQHDPLSQAVGRVIAADVFYAPLSAEHFIAAVVGLYDSEKLPKFSDVGVNLSKLANEPFGVSAKVGEEPSWNIVLEFNPHEVEHQTIEEMMLDAPSCVVRDEDHHFRKAADPLKILYFSISFLAIISNPFSRKFLEVWGKEAGERSIEFAKWVGRSVVRRLKGESRLVFRCELGACLIEFVLDSSDPSAVTDAVRQIYEMGDRIRALYGALEPFIPQKITYGYDRGTNQWFPLHAATVKRGVISERPRLVAVEQLMLGGFSVGGKMTPQKDGR